MSDSRSTSVIVRRAATCTLGLAMLLAPAVIVTQAVQAQTLSILHTFSGPDGGEPRGPLVRDGAGNLYGSAFLAGSFTCHSSGCGTVFKVSSSGKERVLHIFTGLDGIFPNSGLVRDSAGNLYGTTNGGGSGGLGTVFKVDGAGNQTVLYAFVGGADAQLPNGGLVGDPAGNLYGTSQGGDRVCAGLYSCGAVFKVDSAGNETVLHSFNGRNGFFPNGGLVRDRAGNLYGTTGAGGDLTCSPLFYGCGTVFKLDAAGNETVLYRFLGGVDGVDPAGNLIRDEAGNIYGTTINGGASPACGDYGCGTVFKLDAVGNETVLHNFSGPDGLVPDGGLVQDAAGNLYGTTLGGGSYGHGTVFKIDSAGNETVLYSFTGGADGLAPAGPLVLDLAGNLYGATEFGGNLKCNTRTGPGCGTVFKLAP